MTEENLVHCIYASTVKDELTIEDVEKLLLQARQKNESLGVTGMLLFDKGSFFQVIEGESGVIEKLYNAIRRDRRHQKIIKILHEPIEQRSFADWTMGLAKVSAQTLGEIDGLNDFFSRGNCFTELDESKAKKLLEAFKEGRWRSSIS